MKSEILTSLESLRPYLIADGGDLELISFKEGVVTIRFSGACAGCSSAQTTLKEYIEARLKKAVPGIAEVRQAPPLEATPQPGVTAAPTAEGPSSPSSRNPNGGSESPSLGQPVTAALRRTHASAKRLLARLGLTLAAIENGGREAIYLQTLNEMQTFLETDMHIHEHQEEEVLFPALLPFISWGSPMSRRVKEHRILNDQTKSLRPAIAEFEQGGPPNRVVELCRSITQRIQDDLYHEENVLFTLADKVLTGARADALREAMERIEAATKRAR